MTRFQLFSVFVLLTIGSIYHYNGQADGLNFLCIGDSLTPAQMANEIISSICFVSAAIILALTDPAGKK